MPNAEKIYNLSNKLISEILYQDILIHFVIAVFVISFNKRLAIEEDIIINDSDAMGDWKQVCLGVCGSPVISYNKFADIHVPYGVLMMNYPKYMFQFLNHTESQKIECSIMKTVFNLLNTDNNNNNNDIIKFIASLVPQLWYLNHRSHFHETLSAL